MYRKQKRGLELARRTLIYTIMVLAVCTLAFILIFHTLGYQLDLKTQTVEQRALVQYDSRPQGARVFVDGTELGKTHIKGMLPEGQHQFSMRLDGYDEWRKVVEVKAGTLTWLSYARLVPSERVVSSVKEFSSLASVRFSPNWRFMLGVMQATDAPKIVWGDLRDSDKPKFNEVTLDTSVVAGYGGQSTAHALKIVEWDSGNRYAILKHTYVVEGQGEKVQWLKVDRENKTVVDIAKVIGLELKDVRFLGESGNELYVLQSSGELRRADLNAATISAPLISHVQSFSVYGTDYITYVGTNGTSKLQLAGIWRKDWTEPVVVRRQTEAEASTPLMIKFSRYDNKDVLVVGVGSTVTLHTGAALDGSSSSASRLLSRVKSITAGEQLAELDLSGTGRFVLMRTGAGFMSYDIERQSMSHDTALPTGTSLDWLDDYHVWSVEGGKVVMREFDGANQSTMLEASEGFDASLSHDGDWLYAFRRADNGTVTMSRLRMTIKH